MIQKTINLYSFDELSEDAQQKAIEDYRNADLDCFSDLVEFIIDDFITICKIIGIDLRNKNPIFYSVGYCQSDFASFFGTYEYNKGAYKALKHYAPMDTILLDYVKQLQALQSKYFYGLTVTIDSTPRNNMQIETYDKNDNNRKELDSEFDDIFSGIAHNLYISLRNELDYVNSNEYIIELITANEYTFTSDGKME